VKWRAQTASSENENHSGSSILNSGSLLANLNIVDSVPEETSEAAPSSTDISLGERFMHFLKAILDALYSLFA